MSNLTVVKNHKKLSSPLNSPPSICLEYKISSKLKHFLFLVHNFGPKTDKCQHWQVSKITKNFVTIEFRAFDLCRVSNFIKTEALATSVQNYGLKDDRCQYWQVSNLTDVKNHKTLLPLLNSPTSICAEYEISSKLKHLPFFVQNCSLTDDRCQYWQPSEITKTYCHHWIHRPRFVQSTKFHQKLKHLPFFVQNYGPKDDRQVPSLAGVKNHRKLFSSMNSAPSNCSLCNVNRSPLPVPLLLKLSQYSQENTCVGASF